MDEFLIKLKEENEKLKDRKKIYIDIIDPEPINNPYNDN
jgi:hypothetical protein